MAHLGAQRQADDDPASFPERCADVAVRIARNRDAVGEYWCLEANSLWGIRQRHPQCSDDEVALRIDLAAAFRLAFRASWDDQLATHMSARVPGPQTHVLINPYGFLFDEITASSLVKIDLAGNPVGQSPAPVNRAGFVIHAAREDAPVIIHLHTVAGTAVAAQSAGLLPLSPAARSLHGAIGYHDFEGVTVLEAEQSRIVASLGSNRALLFRNHGTLTVGRTVAEAFNRMYMLERSCQIQVVAQAGGGALVQPSPASAFASMLAQ